MAGAKKHGERSKRSHNDYKPFAMFESKARIRKYKTENKSFFANLFKK